jgi:flagellar motor protein MotB
MKRKNNGEGLEADGSAFNTSISDLMAGLLGIFVLALSFFMLNYSEVTDKYTGNLDKRDQILEKVKHEMQNHGVQVHIDTKQGVLRIPESVLFESGQADIKPEGQAAVLELSHAIESVISQDEYKQAIETVFIEGHTDNVPIENEYFHSNWELSTQRAINTWNLMRSDTPELETFKNTQGQPMFSCSGYADTRPVTDDGLDEDSEEGRQANRRIDIRFAMMPPDDGKVK